MSLSATKLASVANRSTSTTIPLAITVPAGGGRVVLTIAWETNSAGNLTIVSVLGLSASWVRRARNAAGAPDNQVTETWWADFSGTATGTVTVTVSGTFDDACMGATLITSSTSAAIQWDPNASLPATPAAGTKSASVSSSASPFVFVCSGDPQSLFTGPTPAGMSNLYTMVNLGGTLSQNTSVDTGSPAQLNSTTTGYTAGGSAFGTVIIDALEEVSATPPAGLNSGGLGTGGLGSGGLK